METKERQVEVSAEPMEKPKMYVQHIYDAAQELYEVEAAIDDLTKVQKEALKPLEEKKEQMRATLLTLMGEARQKHVDVNNGQNFYVRAVKTSFEVDNEEKAMKWAKKNDVLRIDKTAAAKILLRTPKIPAGFQQVDTEFLQRKAAKDRE